MNCEVNYPVGISGTLLCIAGEIPLLVVIKQFLIQVKCTEALLHSISIESPPMTVEMYVKVLCQNTNIT